MATVVFQSFRTHAVPAWISRCMGTVREWAASRGYAYRFIDDDIFERVPTWFRRKAAHVCTVMDMARLIVARELLEREFERAVWVDADIVVFDPESMTIPQSAAFFLAREIWFSRTPRGGTACCDRVNNSVAGFTRGSAQLDFLIDTCERIARQTPQLDKLAIGTRFLTQLHQRAPVPLLQRVGLFSPLIMAGTASGADRCLQAYARHLPAPLACANLCLSFRGARIGDLQFDDALAEKVFDRCMQTRGEVVNRFVRAERNGQAMIANRL